MDNFEVAIYQMLNELAQRHGLRPRDFRAEFREYEQAGRSCHELAFVSPASENTQMLMKYRTLLANLGINLDRSQELIGSEDVIYDKLEYALSVVPAKSNNPRRR